jgi:hypothetical protein
MTKKPILSALLAYLYIIFVANIIYYGPRLFLNAAGKVDTPTVLIPIAMISLFTLSAAVMGYLFCYEPLRMYLDGAKQDAVSLFLKTVASFAVITIISFVLLFTVLH